MVITCRSKKITIDDELAKKYVFELSERGIASLLAAFYETRDITAIIDNYPEEELSNAASYMIRQTNQLAERI